MIIVTRLGGPAFAVNPDLIERADSNPDTVLTLVDGTKYVIAESLDQLIVLIRDYRSSVIAGASLQERLLRAQAQPARRGSTEGTVVPLPSRER